MVSREPAGAFATLKDFLPHQKKERYKRKSISEKFLRNKESTKNPIESNTINQSKTESC